MNGAGDRIFGNAITGSEVARDEIDFIAGSGDGYGVGMEVAELSEIGASVADSALGVVNRDVSFIRFQHLGREWAGPQAEDQIMRWIWTGLGEICRKIHGEEFAILLAGRRAADA